MSGIPDNGGERGVLCEGRCYRLGMDTPALSHDPNWYRAGNFSPFDAGSTSDVTLVGVPTWRTSLSPTHAGVTPAAVREALRRYSTHAVSPLGGQQWELHEVLSISDAGDIEEPDLDEAAAAAQIRAIARQSQLVIALGGDNALTVPVAAGVAGDTPEKAGIITLDAHHDLREGRSNGSPIRRLIEEHGFNPQRIVQIGIADFANSKPYRDYANEQGITVIHRDELHRRPIDEVVEEALDIAGAGGGPIHVDLDVDVCDRSVAPACPASIPGGISAYELRLAARTAARDFRVKSIDLAEVDATADTPDERTVRLTAQAVLEAIAGCAQRERAPLPQ